MTATSPQIAPVEAPLSPRMSAERLDQLADEREKLKARIDVINDLVKKAVEAHGFTPPKADKSKRLLGEKWQATVSYGTSTEIHDAGVEAIRRVTPIGLFGQLFKEVKQYKLVDGASMVLARTLPPGAPANLRRLFQAAVVITQKEPSLRLELQKK
jgi:hypothetical protein